MSGPRYMEWYVSREATPTLVQYERTVAAIRDLRPTSWKQRCQRWQILASVRVFGLPTQDDLDAIRERRGR